MRTADGRPLRGDVRLPSLPGIEPLEEPMLDRFSRLVFDNRTLTVAAMGAGAITGFAHGSGMFGRVGRGIGGAVLGLVGALGVATVAGLVSGRSSTSTTAHVANVPGATDVPRTGVRGERVRVMDWNVHQLTGHNDVGFDQAAVDALVATVRREQPDVLVLQEVSQRATEAGGRDQLALLAELLGASDAVLVPNGIRPDGGRKGNAVLTFGEATIQDARGLRSPDPNGSSLLHRSKSLVGLLEHLDIDVPASLQGPGYFPRTPGDVIVTTAGGTDVRVLDVHLSGTGLGSGGTPGSVAAQERQLVPLAATVGAWRGRTILTGDFNVRGGTREHQFEVATLEAVGLRDAATAVGIRPGSDELRTWPSHGPAYKGIDRTYVSDGLRPEQLRVLHDDQVVPASDHLPVVTDVVVT